MINTWLHYYYVRCKKKHIPYPSPNGQNIYIPYPRPQAQIAHIVPLPPGENNALKLITSNSHRLYIEGIKYFDFS